MIFSSNEENIILPKVGCGRVVGGRGKREAGERVKEEGLSVNVLWEGRAVWSSSIFFVFS